MSAAVADEAFLEQGGDPKIFTRTWRPAGKARGVIVVVHGFNSHSGYYGNVAESWVALGFAVYALDLRGRGKSEGERFYVESFDDYVADVAKLVERARTREAGLPIFLFGHSAGGVVACLYTLSHQADLAGLVCESFAFQLPAPDLALALLKGLSHVAPHVRSLVLKNETFSRDPAVVAKMNADPLIAGEAQPLKTMAAMVRADEHLAKSFAEFRLPLLILHGTADVDAKASGSQRFYDAASSGDKTLKLYEGHVHDLLSDVDAGRVMADIDAWLVARAAPVAGATP